jgi:homocysteine S-methyltransferase
MGRPVWLSVTVDDGDGSRLRSGEAVADLAAIARGGASAVLAMVSAASRRRCAMFSSKGCGSL